MKPYGNVPNAVLDVREASQHAWMGLTALLNKQPYLVIGKDGNKFVLEGQDGDIQTLLQFEWNPATENSKLIAASRNEGSALTKGSVLGSYTVGPLRYHEGEWYVMQADSDDVLPFNSILERIEAHRQDPLKLAWEIRMAERRKQGILNDGIGVGDRLTCPECGQHDIEPSQMYDHSIYECRNCGKQGYEEEFAEGTPEYSDEGGDLDWYPDYSGPEHDGDMSFASVRTSDLGFVPHELGQQIYMGLVGTAFAATYGIDAVKRLVQKIQNGESPEQAVREDVPSEYQAEVLQGLGGDRTFNEGVDYPYTEGGDRNMPLASVSGWQKGSPYPSDSYKNAPDHTPKGQKSWPKEVNAIYNACMREGNGRGDTKDEKESSCAAIAWAQYDKGKKDSKVGMRGYPDRQTAFELFVGDIMKHLGLTNVDQTTYDNIHNAVLETTRGEVPDMGRNDFSRMQSKPYQKGLEQVSQVLQQKLPELDGLVQQAQIPSQDYRQDWIDENQGGIRSRGKVAGDVETVVTSTVENGGGTFDATTLDEFSPATGYFASKNGVQVPTDTFSAEVLSNALQTMQLGKGEYLGTWVEGNVTYIDPARWFEDQDTAMSFAEQNGQAAIWDVANNTAIHVREQVKSASVFEMNLPPYGIHFRTHAAMGKAGLTATVTYPPIPAYPDGLVSTVPGRTAMDEMDYAMEVEDAGGNLSDVRVQVDAPDGQEEQVRQLINQLGGAPDDLVDPQMNQGGEHDDIGRAI